MTSWPLHIRSSAITYREKMTLNPSKPKNNVLTGQSSFSLWWFEQCRHLNEAWDDEESEAEFLADGILPTLVTHFSEFLESELELDILKPTQSKKIRLSRREIKN